MTSRLGQRRLDRGFTLLELLIAGVVAAFVLLVINGTYFDALKLHNSTEAKVDQDLVLDRTLGLVQRDLEGLMLPAAPTAPGAGRHVLRASSRTRRRTPRARSYRRCG